MDIIYSIFILKFLIQNAFALNLRNCRIPLGMQSGDISDLALSASSSFDENTVGPKHSRIRTEIGGGAWCPATQIHSGSYEYLEINLGNLTAITSVETQGRFGNGQGQEYVEQYMIEYQREDSKRWIKYRDHKGEMIINGNTNTYIAEIKEISPVIIAKRIRFIPYSKTKRTVCLRAELYGCKFQDGLLWYRIPQGKRRNDIDFIDNTYDGIIEDNLLKDGLGQLVDGELGDNLFRRDKHFHKQKGYEWIGWQRESTNTEQFIPFTFKFDRIRNFSHVLIYTTNMLSKDIQIFNKVIVQFSIDGKFMKSTSENRAFAKKISDLIFNIDTDTSNESSHFVKLNLDHHIGRFIRIKLYFTSKWMLVSEIEFNSSILNENYKPIETYQTNDIELAYQQDPSIDYYVQITKISKQDPNNIEYSLYDTGEDGINTKNNLDYGKNFKLMLKNDTQSSLISVLKDSTSSTQSTTNDSVLQFKPKQIYFLIALICTILLICLLIFLIILFIRMKKLKEKCKFQTMMKEKLVQNNSVYTNMPLKVNLPFESSLQYDQSKLLLTPIKNRLHPILMNGQMASLSSNSSTSSPSTEVTQALMQTYHTLQPSWDTNSDYAVKKHYYSTTETEIVDQFKGFNECNNLGSSETDTHTPLYYEASPYATVDVFDEITLECGSIQGACGNSTFLMLDKITLLNQACLNDNTIKRKNMDVSKIISNGEFGMICIVTSINESNSTSSMSVGRLLSTSLDTRFTNTKNSTFIEELAILSRINHPNLANMIGYTENPYCICTEYVIDGHLDQFLKTHINNISYNTQLLILSQISSAMKYLEQIDLVHRDLAIRNCIVTNLRSIQTNYSNLTHTIVEIKLTDIAISMPEYRKDYYLYKNSILLPIRYMPAESLFQGQFTNASNVWSFGILIWQLFTNSTSTPFTEWSNYDFLYNLKTAYVASLSLESSTKKPIFQPNGLLKNDTILSPNSPLKTQLQVTSPSTRTRRSPYTSLKHLKKPVCSEYTPNIVQTHNLSSFILCCLNMVMPINCTKEIYDLMIECCNMNMNQRPRFNDIDLFLQNKISGAKLPCSNYTVVF